MAAAEDSTLLQITVGGKEHYVQVDPGLLKSLNSNDPMIKHQAFTLIQQEIQSQQGSENVLQSGTITDLQQIPSTPADIDETQEEQTDEMESVSSDIEDYSAKRSTSPWPIEATTLLISLYKTHEEAMEDTSNKKKNVWADITKEMNNAGYSYSQNKVESKWRSLLKSHKLVKGNRSQTGAKRKSFQHFEQIDEIVSKRHDINPPYVQGSGKTMSKPKKFMAKHTSDENSDTSHEKVEKNKKIKKKANTESVALETLQFLKGAEERRREENEERERNKDRRSAERNDILKSFLDVFKKTVDG